MSFQNNASRTPKLTTLASKNCFISDVDECNEESHRCSSDAICTNEIGNYTCDCRDGFSGDGFSCIGRFQLDFVGNKFRSDPGQLFKGNPEKHCTKLGMIIYRSFAQILTQTQIQIDTQFLYFDKIYFLTFLQRCIANELFFYQFQLSMRLTAYIFQHMLPKFYLLFKGSQRALQVNITNF